MTAETSLTGRPAIRPRPHRLRAWFADKAVIVVPALVVVSVWEIAGRTLDLLVLPPISDILVALWTFIVDGTLAEQLTVSMITLLVGMVISILLGILIGTLMGLSRTVESALDVYINAAMAAPMIAFVPVFIMVFGLGYPTRIITVIVFAIFPIIINTFAGIRQVPAESIEMAKSFGASRGQMIRDVRIPSAFPLMLAGIRLGTARGVKGLINGEVLVTIVGLGGLVQQYGTAFTMDRLYAIIFFIIALAVSLVWLVERISRRIVPQFG